MSKFITPRQQHHARIRKECMKRITSFEDILSSSQERMISYHRRHIVLEYSEQYPDLSTPQLGSIFNKDHSSIVVMRQKALKERKTGPSEWIRTRLPTSGQPA